MVDNAVLQHVECSYSYDSTSFTYFTYFTYNAVIQRGRIGHAVLQRCITAIIAMTLLPLLTLLTML